MLKNHIVIALRNMLRARVYSLINILGLAIGMAATILIVLFVQDELSYDRYHENSDWIYRVSREWLNTDGSSNLHLGHLAPPFAPLLENDFEGVVLQAVRFLGGGNPLMTTEEKKIQEERMFFADPDIFKVFSWKLIFGDPATVLSDPHSLVLTESAAQRYFGDEDPIGKTITYNNFGEQLPMKVTGLIQDVPHNSHFQFDMLCAFGTVEEVFGRENLMSNWGSNNYATYLLFPEGYDVADFEAQIPGFIDKHLGQTSSDQPQSTYNKLHLMPITDIHLYSHLDSEIEPNGDIAYVYIYTIIAVFILVIACINFMNLSTARSARRAKEVGLRKVMGAFRISLVRQFMVESVFYALIALLLSLLVIHLALPFFNNFVQKEIALDLFENQFIFVILFSIILFVGLVAGSYPALYLSSFKPASILKGGHKAVGDKVNLRSVLVVLQFFISIVLVIGVGIIEDQLQYMRTKDLGFDQSNLLILPSSGPIYEQFENVRNRLLRQPGIEGVSLASRVPSGRLLDSQGGAYEIDGEMKKIGFRVADVHIDHSYLENFGIELVAGRNFNPDLAIDSTEAFILNEIAVIQLGYENAEAAIDKKFDYGPRKGRIIGVVKDFHFESLLQPIAPIVFLITTGRHNLACIRYNPERKEEVLEHLQEQWSFLREGFPFDYFEVSESFDEQYEGEDKLATVVRWFSALAIVVAALGLFGLASFITEQRIKEIGIRKVLGATVLQVLVLLTKGFTLLVLVGFVIAAPLAYYGMDLWLEGFAYQGAIKVWPFLYAGCFALLVAWITVSFQTLRAVMANPVDALRYE